MSYLRDNSNLVKGDELWLFLGTKEGFEVPTCFSQQHSLNRSLSTTSVSSKDHGNTSYVIPGEGSWTCSTEALMSMNTEDDNSMAFVDVMDVYDKGDKVYVKFGKLSNYVEKGIVNVDTTNLPEKTREGWKLDTPYWKGEGYITSLQASGGHGDSATFSIEITGIGPLTKVTNPEPGPTPTPTTYDITYDFDEALTNSNYTSRPDSGGLEYNATTAEKDYPISIECTNDLTEDMVQISATGVVLDDSQTDVWTFDMPENDVTVTARRKYEVKLVYTDNSYWNVTDNNNVNTQYFLPGEEVRIKADDASHGDTYYNVTSDPSGIQWAWDGSSYWNIMMPDIYEDYNSYTYITATIASRNV